MELALDLRQADPLAEQLEKTAELTADVVAARLIATGQIAGGQLLQLGAQRQILRAGVAQHDVVAAIDQLPPRVCPSSARKANWPPGMARSMASG